MNNTFYFFQIIGNIFTLLWTIATFFSIKKVKHFHVNIKAILFCFLYDVTLNSIGSIASLAILIYAPDKSESKLRLLFISIQTSGSICFAFNSIKILIERFFSLKNSGKYEKSDFTWGIYLLHLSEFGIIVAIKYNLVNTRFFMIVQIICISLSLSLYPILMYIQKKLHHKIIENFKNNSVFSLTQKYQILETEKTAKLLLPFIILVAVTTFFIGLIYYLSAYGIIAYLRDTISVLFFLFITISQCKWRKLFGHKIFQNRVFIVEPVKISSAGANGSLYFEQLHKQWL